MTQATKTPIEPGLIARLVAGVRYGLTGSAPDWFGPGDPLPPVAQEQAAGRQFDYPVAMNLRLRPRDGEAVGFEQMRALADSYDLLRLVIETRKDQMSKLRWTIKPRDPKAQTDKRCDEVTDFLQFPDQEHNWQTWLRMVMEDMLVIDAATVYPRLTNGGSLYALEPIDGATIKRVLDATGRTPLPPDPAYQQVLKGLPAVDYSRDELIYLPRNPRTSRVYGYSPVEQIIMTVNIALRRQLHQLQYYTEGNVPEALIGVPETWNPDQIKQFQAYWDSLLEGDTAARRHAKFVPGALKIQETKASALKDEYDEWLARVVCFAFSIEPTPFVKQQNRATAETAREQSLAEGLAPLQNWVRDMINLVIMKWFGHRDIEFAWDEEEAVDPLVQAQINQIYVTAKVLHPDEVRADLGREPLTPEQKEEMNPPPPPMMSGVPDNDDESTPPGKKKQPPMQDDASAKGALAKGKKSIRPINRDRPAVAKARKQLADAVTKFLAAQAPKIADQIAAALGLEKSSQGGGVREKARHIVDALSFNAWADDLPGIVEPMLSGIAVAGGKLALDQIDVMGDDITRLMRERAEAWAANRAAEMVGMKWVDGELLPNPDARWQITEGTREMVRSFTEQALDEGWSAQELADQIGESYAFSENRAEMIARTEIAKADVAGTMQGYRASGVVKMKRWLTAEDDKVSDECMECEKAGAIGIDDTFPSGEDAPPNHPNCRCAVLPVLDDEAPVLLEQDQD